METQQISADLAPLTVRCCPRRTTATETESEHAPVEPAETHPLTA
jgi:hypothetical protein